MAFSRIVFALLVSLLFNSLTAAAMPWKRAEDNFLALVSQGTLVLAVCCCALIKILENPSSPGEELNLIYDSKGPYFVLCFIALGFLHVFLSAFAHTIHQHLASSWQHATAMPQPMSPTDSSVGLLVGACVFGLPAGLIGGLYHLTAGVVAAVVVGIAGAALGSQINHLQALGTRCKMPKIQPVFVSAEPSFSQ